MNSSPNADSPGSDMNTSYTSYDDSDNYQLAEACIEAEACSINGGDLYGAINASSTQNFSLKTLKSLYKNTLQTGANNHFLALIPGIGNNLVAAMSTKEGVKQIKRYLIIMDSMTQDEMDLKKVMNESRRRR